MFFNILLLLNINLLNGFYTKNVNKYLHALSPLENNQQYKNIDSFNWEKQWYPIAVEEFTDKLKSHKISLFGNDLVLWYSGNAWSILEDKCPHRGAPLSEGRVEKTGELLCAYHAWTFNCDGNCTNIPQAIDDNQKLKACVKSYPTMIDQGLIWVWGDNNVLDSLLKEPRLIEELNDKQYNNRYKPVKWYSRDLPYGWDIFMENVLDPSHVPVAHHGIVGNRYKDAHNIKFTKIKSFSEIEKKSFSIQGPGGINIPFSQDGDLNPLYPCDSGFSYLMKNENISIIHDFRPPCLTKITMDLPDGGKTILALYATPTKPGYCRYFGFQLLIKPENILGEKPKGLGFYDIDMPKWLQHIITSIFLHQDLVLLHYQDRILSSHSNYAFGNFDNKFNLSNNFNLYAKNYYMPTENDKQIIALRRWISSKANGGPIWKSINGVSIPSKLEPEQLFDVYNSHTKNCLICQKTLNNIMLIKNIAIVSTLISLLVFNNILYSGIFSIIIVICSKITELFYKYEFNHQDNN